MRRYSSPLLLPACLLLVLASIFSTGSAATTEQPPLHRRPRLPDAFVVSTGTTMPFEDLDPVAQSGMIYFDRRAGQMRIDNFWMGTQRSFLVDTTRGRAYVINGGTCVTSVVSGQLLPVEVPEAAIRDHDVHSVRGVSVDRFHQVVRDDDLMHLDYFFRKSNFTVADSSSGRRGEFWTPWRVTTHRVERQELIAAPDRPNPNWRFFGEKPSDAIVRFGSDGRALKRLTRGVTVTVDFFNFVPIVPDPHVFEAPEALCSEAPTSTYADGVDLFEVARNMVELSFNNEEGHRLMRELWDEHDFAHELPPGPSAKKKKDDDDDKGASKNGDL